MLYNTGQIRDVDNPTSKRRVRLVRDFQVGEAYAYWEETHQNDTTWSPSIQITQVGTTDHEWKIVFNGDTFSGIKDANYYPKYDFSFHETVCQSSTKYNSAVNSNFKNLDIGRAILSRGLPCQ